MTTPAQPPGPGWWLASDGQWYPPQAAAGPPAPGAPYATLPGTAVPPPAPGTSGRGCLTAILIVGLVLVVLGGLGAFAVYKLIGKADELVPGLTGDVECLTEDEVSDIVGYPVTLVVSANIGLAAGCNYSAADAEAEPRVGVAMVVGSGVIAESEIDGLVDLAESNGAEAVSIDPGDDGRAWGSPQRSEAITKWDGKVVEVEVFSEGIEPIGERRDAAVELLGMFLDAQ